MRLPTSRALAAVEIAGTYTVKSGVGSLKSHAPGSSTLTLNADGSASGQGDLRWLGSSQQAITGSWQFESPQGGWRGVRLRWIEGQGASDRTLTEFLTFYGRRAPFVIGFASELPDTDKSLWLEQTPALPP